MLPPTTRDLERQLANLTARLDACYAEMQRLEANMKRLHQLITDVYNEMKSKPWNFLTLKAQADAWQVEINNDAAAFEVQRRESERLNDEIAEVERKLEAIYGENRARVARPLKAGEVALYSRENFTGDAHLLKADAANWPHYPVASLRVGPNTGVTLFAEPDFGGASQPLTTDLAQTSVSRLGAAPRSLQIWPARTRKFKGRWTLRLSNGLYLTVGPDGFLTARDGESALDDQSLFSIQVRGQQDGPRVEARVVHPDAYKPPQGEKPPKGAFILASVRTLVYERGSGRARFAMLTGAGRWVAYDPQANRLFTTDAQAKRAIFAFGVGYCEREDQVGALRPGEAVIYDNPGFWGAAWVLDDDVAHFGALPFGNDRAGSVQLAPRTAATLFEHTGFQGIAEDHARSVPDMARAQPGRDQLSSILLWRVVPAEKYGISFRYSLSEHDFRQPNGSYQRRSAYCITLKLPFGAGAARVWATDTLSAEINGTSYPVIDEYAHSAEVAPNPLGQVIIAIPASALACPAIKLHLAGMGDDERILIYPDRDLHERVASMKPNALWNGEIKPRRNQHGQVVSPAGPLVDKTKYDKRLVDAVQATVGRAMGAISYRVERSRVATGASGVAFDDDPPVMTQSIDAGIAWTVSFREALDGGPGGASFAEMDDFAATQSSASLSAVDAPVPDTVAFITWPPIVPPIDPPPLPDPLKEVNEWWAKIVNAWNLTISKLQDGLEIVIQFAEAGVLRAERWVLTTANQVAAFAQGVFQKIEVAWNKLIEFFNDLFDWEDILREQDAIMRLANESLIAAEGRIHAIKEPVKRFFDQHLDEVKRHLRAPELAARPTPKEKARKSLEMPEEVERIINIMFGHSIPGDAFGLTLAGDATALATQFEQFAEDMAQFGGRASSIFGEAGTVVNLLIDNPDNPARALDQIFEALRTLLAAVLNAVRDGVLNGLELLAQFIVLIRELLNKSINIPGLAQYYGMLTRGKSLTVLSLTSLMIAIPTVAMRKAMGIGQVSYVVAGPGLSASQAAAPSLSLDAIKVAYKTLGLSADFIGSVLSTGLDTIPETAETNTGFLEGCNLATAWVSWLCGFPGTTPFNFDQEKEKGRVANQLELAGWGIKSFFLAFDTAFVIIGAIPGLQNKVGQKFPQNLSRGNTVTFGISTARGLVLWGIGMARVFTREDKVASDGKANPVYILESGIETFENYADIFAPLRSASLYTSSAGKSHVGMMVVNSTSRSIKLGLQSAVLAIDASKL